MLLIICLKFRIFRLNTMTADHGKKYWQGDVPRNIEIGGYSNNDLPAVVEGVVRRIEHQNTILKSPVEVVIYSDSIKVRAPGATS